MISFYIIYNDIYNSKNHLILSVLKIAANPTKDVVAQKVA